MGKKVEMIGRRFGRIIVISEDKRDSHQSVTEWAEETGINRATIYQRIKLGYKGIDLIKPVNQAYSHSEQIKEYYEARRFLPVMTDPEY